MTFPVRAFFASTIDGFPQAPTWDSEEQTSEQKKKGAGARVIGARCPNLFGLRAAAAEERNADEAETQQGRHEITEKCSGRTTFIVISSQ
jgi:hypothetical protein